MNRLYLLVVLALVAPLSAQGANIYKCTGGRYVAYQNYPCPDGLDQSVMSDAPRVAVQQVPETRWPASQSQNAVPPSQMNAEMPTARPQLPFGRTALRIGVSDDEVLNMPRWGVPERITRNKVNGIWHEDWIYGARNGTPKHLHFANAVLTSIDTDYAGPPTQLASAQ